MKRIKREPKTSIIQGVMGCFALAIMSWLIHAAANVSEFDKNMLLRFRFSDLRDWRFWVTLIVIPLMQGLGAWLTYAFGHMVQESWEAWRSRR
jgi:hypothetical protein